MYDKYTQEKLKQIQSYFSLVVSWFGLGADFEIERLSVFRKPMFGCFMEFPKSVSLRT